MEQIRNMSLPKKILISICIVFTIIIVVSVFSSNKRIKNFQIEVNNFLECWDRLIEIQRKEPLDRVGEDIYYKNLVYSMKEISRMYVDFSDKGLINDYLIEHTWREQYEKIMNYNKEHDNIKIEQEFIDFYTNNMELHN